MRLRTKLLIVFTALFATALLGNSMLVALQGRRAMLQGATERVEALTAILTEANAYGFQVREGVGKLLAAQMIVQASLTAHLVDVAENSAHFSPEQINERLKDIADTTILDEFWITDEQGYAYLRNREDIDFTFPSKPTELNQAWWFWHLLSEKRGQFAQEPMKREHDGEMFQYAAVSGIDRPRIVQVGFKQSSLEGLSAGINVESLVQTVVGDGGILRVRVASPHRDLLIDTDFGNRLQTQGNRIHDNELIAMIQEALDNNQMIPRLNMARGNMVAVSPFNTPKGPLALLVTFDISPMAASLRQAQWFGVLGTSALLMLGIFLALRISRRIADPIQTLAEEAIEIGHGNLDRQITLKAGGEVLTLANAFNQMTHSLKAHIEQLRNATVLRERTESEMRLAAKVQTLMLPTQPPAVPGVQVFATMQPAYEVGGDFYDFVPHHDGKLALLIGDASGKGLPAALYAAQSLSVVRALALRSKTAANVLADANAVLYVSGGEAGLFATALYGLYDPLERTLNFANAGHCRPILIRRGEAIEPLPSENSLPLGLVLDYETFEQKEQLQVNDVMILYSDGVTEAMNPQGELFSLNRLIECLERSRDLAPEDIIECVNQTVRDFIGGAHLSDDMTVMAIHVGEADSLATNQANLIK